MAKTLPSNIDAEKTVLGACFSRPYDLDYAVQKLKPDDFYDIRNLKIFGAIYELHRKGKSVDELTVMDYLSESGDGVIVGGLSYINELSTAALTLTNIEAYVEIVESKSVLRQLIISSDSIKEKAENFAEASEVIEYAEKTIFNISEKRDRGELERIEDVLNQGLKHLIDNPPPKDGISGFDTGLLDVNNILSGFQRSDFVLIAARPSMGKTALGLNICKNAALKADASVAMFSLEMAKEQYVQRMLAAESSISLSAIKTGQLQEDEWSLLLAAVGKLSKSKIYVDDTAAITVSEIRAKCRRLKMEHGLDLIMIDYLQLMTGSKAENRQQEISNISRNLKALARELDCPVLALSQLSRAPEQRADHRPLLSDLRESGAIEQDADVVMFLYRDEYYFEDKEDNKNLAELIIGKQRNGETGTINLHWMGQYQVFRDLSQRQA